MSTEPTSATAPVQPVVLLQLHVAWNETNGEPDKLTSIEFGDDCEICAVETDVLDGLLRVNRPLNVFACHVSLLPKVRSQPLVDRLLPAVTATIWTAAVANPATRST